MQKIKESFKNNLVTQKRATFPKKKIREKNLNFTSCQRTSWCHVRRGSTRKDEFGLLFRQLTSHFRLRHQPRPPGAIVPECGRLGPGKSWRPGNEPSKAKLIIDRMNFRKLPDDAEQGLLQT